MLLPTSYKCILLISMYFYFSESLVCVGCSTSDTTTIVLLSYDDLTPELVVTHALDAWNTRATESGQFLLYCTVAENKVLYLQQDGTLSVTVPTHGFWYIQNLLYLYEPSSPHHPSGFALRVNHDTHTLEASPHSRHECRLVHTLHTPGLDYTPVLLHACQTQHTEKVQLLLQQSSHYPQSMWWAVDPVHHATPLMWLCFHGHETEAAQLLALGRANAEAVDRHGNTAFHYACARGLLSIALDLLTITPNHLVGAPNGVHMTPLMYACNLSVCHKRVALALLATSYANETYVNPERNESALHWACRTCTHDNQSVISVLLSRSLPILTLCTYQGESALLLACLQKNEDVVTQLVEAHTHLDKPYSTAHSWLLMQSIVNQEWVRPLRTISSWV